MLQLSRGDAAASSSSRSTSERTDDPGNEQPMTLQQLREAYNAEYFYLGSTEAKDKLEWVENSLNRALVAQADALCAKKYPARHLGRCEN